MARIFISYKRVDKDIVFKVKDKIESALGEKCWIDLDGIESDAQFKNVIIRAINECEIVLFMYSKIHTQISDYEKDWTVRELNFAARKNKRIVFVNIDNSPLSDVFEFDFGTKQQVDGTSAEALLRLINDLKNWLGSTQDISSDNDEDPYEIGERYYYGEGVSQDYAEAVKWYRKAADQGNADAQNQLGECYYYGHGVPEDEIEAVKWYRKSAEQGHAWAQYNLGDCYFKGRGVSKNQYDAVPWFLKAAEQGNHRAQYMLGYCHYYAKGASWDYDEAVKWYRKAAEQGNADAQYELAECYHYGHGVPEDETEAFKWYRKTAEQGNADAQYKVGYCYYYGVGVPVNEAKAEEYLQRAADQGNKKAKDLLLEIFTDDFLLTK